MDGVCRREIEALHVFFEDWFTGRVADTDKAFERCTGALAPGFEMVTPDGKSLDRDTALIGIRAAHGSHAPDGFRIWLRAARVRPVTDGLSIVTYEEWQTRKTVTRGRLSTALLGLRPEAPGGVEWLSVHETWLPGAG